MNLEPIEIENQIANVPKWQHLKAVMKAMSKPPSTSPSSIKTLEEASGVEGFILLEQYRFLDQSIDGMSKNFKETIDAVTSLLESSADSFRRIRVSAITGAGSIIIPLLLALATLDSTHTIVNIAFTLSAFSIVVAGVLTFWTTLKISSIEKRCNEMHREFSFASVALGGVQNYLRASAALQGVKEYSSGWNIKEFYEFFIFLETAIRHWIMHIARNDWLRLDEPTRRVFEDQTRLYCENKEQGFWAMVDKPLVKSWLSDPVIGKIVQEYKQWCSDMSKSRPVSKPQLD